MKTHRSLGHHLPFVNKVLFGDRQKFGLVSDRSDTMWDEWETVCSQFYSANQRSGFGQTVNDAGYKILGEYDFTGKTVMEIGPGFAPHLPFFKTHPDHYILVDIREEFLESASEKLEKMGISYEKHLINPEKPHILPLDTGSIDTIVTFYSLEHLYPLSSFVDEYQRVLRDGGHVVGGIPAEGGLAWGLGRFLTSRRWLKKNTTINPDKLICWEHPNFADHILTTLEENFEFGQLNYWPLKVPLIDTNLIVSFIAQLKAQSADQ